MRALVALTLLAASPVLAESIADAPDFGASPKNMALELRLGVYQPLVDRAFTTSPGPYQKTFGNGMMLLAELEIERQLWQRFGSIAVGVSGGYTEKYGHAIADATGETTGEAVSLQLIPVKLLAIYRFDWLQTKYGIPLVPFAKFGLAATYWWASKGGQLEVADGIPGRNISWGVAGMAGIAFLLDILDPRLARDFDSGVGVNHSYLFAEFNFTEINNFGAKTAGTATVPSVPSALDLSGRYAMFGLAFEY
jgi:hypothetical protein